MANNTLHSVPEPTPEEKSAQSAEVEKDVKSPEDEEAKDKVGPMPSPDKGSKGKQKVHIRVAHPSVAMAPQSGGSGPESVLVEEDNPQDELIAQRVAEVETTEDNLVAPDVRASKTESNLSQDSVVGEQLLNPNVDKAQQRDILTPAGIQSYALFGTHESGSRETDDVPQSIESAQPITGSSNVDSLGHGGVPSIAAVSEPGSDLAPSSIAASQDLAPTQQEPTSNDTVVDKFSHHITDPSKVSPDGENDDADGPDSHVVAMESDIIQVQGSDIPVNQDSSKVVGLEELPETADQNTSGSEQHDKNIPLPVQVSHIEQRSPDAIIMAPLQEQKVHPLEEHDAGLLHTADKATVTDAKTDAPVSTSLHGKDEEPSDLSHEAPIPPDVIVEAGDGPTNVTSLDEATSIEDSAKTKSSPIEEDVPLEQQQRQFDGNPASVELKSSQLSEEPVTEAGIVPKAEIHTAVSHHQDPEASIVPDAETAHSLELPEDQAPLLDQEAQTDDSLEEEDSKSPAQAKVPMQQSRFVEDLPESISALGTTLPEATENNDQKPLAEHASEPQDRPLITDSDPLVEQEIPSTLVSPIDAVANDSQAVDVVQDQAEPQESEPLLDIDQLETDSIGVQESHGPTEVSISAPEEPQAQHLESQAVLEPAGSQVQSSADAIQDQTPTPETDILDARDPHANIEHVADPITVPDVTAQSKAASFEQPTLPTSHENSNLPTSEESINRKDLAPVSEPAVEAPSTAMESLPALNAEDASTLDPVPESDTAAMPAEPSELQVAAQADAVAESNEVPHDTLVTHESAPSSSATGTDEKELPESPAASIPEASLSVKTPIEDVAPSNSELKGNDNFDNALHESLSESTITQEPESAVEEKPVQSSIEENSLLPEIAATSEDSTVASAVSEHQPDDTMMEPMEDDSLEMNDSFGVNDFPAERGFSAAVEEPTLESEPPRGVSDSALLPIYEPSEPVQSVVTPQQHETLHEKHLAEPQHDVSAIDEIAETVSRNSAAAVYASLQPAEEQAESAFPVSHINEGTAESFGALDHQAQLGAPHEKFAPAVSQDVPSFPQEFKGPAFTEDLQEQTHTAIHEGRSDLPLSAEEDALEAPSNEFHRLYTHEDPPPMEHVAEASPLAQDPFIETTHPPQTSLTDVEVENIVKDFDHEQAQLAHSDEHQTVGQRELDITEHDDTELPATEPDVTESHVSEPDVTEQEVQHTSSGEDQGDEHKGLAAGIVAGAAALTAGAGALVNKLSGATQPHEEPTKDDIPRHLREQSQRGFPLSDIAPEDAAPVVPPRSPARSVSSQLSAEEGNYTLDDHEALDHSDTPAEAAVPRSLNKSSIMSQYSPKAALKQTRQVNAAYSNPSELPANRDQIAPEETTREFLTSPTSVHSGTQTEQDSASKISAQSDLDDVLLSTRSLTPGIVLPDLGDADAKALGRARSLRKSRRRTIRMNEETVAAAVIIHITAKNLSSSLDPQLGSAQVRENISRTRDLEVGSEAGIQDIELTDVDDSVTDNLSTDDEGKKSSHRHRKRRHSSASEEARPDESKKESHRSRRPSEASSKSDTSNLVASKRTDRGVSDSSHGSRRHRTPEEIAAREKRRAERTPEQQAAHDKRKEERRAAKEKEREQEARGKDPETPQSRRESHQSHRSSKRDSVQSTPSQAESASRSVETPSTPPKKSFFDFRRSQSAVTTPNIVSRASEPAVPRASKEATRPDNARRSNTTHHEPSGRSDDVAKSREHRSSRDPEHHRRRRHRERSSERSKTASRPAKEVEDNSSPSAEASRHNRESRAPREHRESRGERHERHPRREQRPSTRDERTKKQASQQSAPTGLKGMLKKIFA